MNQTMTLNIVDTTTMLITIKIPGVIPYVTDNPLADMVQHLNTNILISNAIYIFIIQEQDTFGLFSFSDDAVEE